jgi:hypothetical protein
MGNALGVGGLVYWTCLEIKMVYVIKDKKADLYKIGYSCNPIDRIRSFQIGSENLETILIMPGDRSKEKILHKHFSHRRVRHPNPKGFTGNGWTEWFRLSQKEISRIRNLYIKKLDSMEEKMDYLERTVRIQAGNAKIFYSVIQNLEDTIDKISKIYMGKLWADKNSGVDRDIFKDPIALEFMSYKRYSNLKKDLNDLTTPHQ